MQRLTPNSPAQLRDKAHDLYVAAGGKKTDICYFRDRSTYYENQPTLWLQYGASYDNIHNALKNRPIAITTVMFIGQFGMDQLNALKLIAPLHDQLEVIEFFFYDHFPTNLGKRQLETIQSAHLRFKNLTAINFINCNEQAINRKLQEHQLQIEKINFTHAPALPILIAAPASLPPVSASTSTSPTSAAAPTASASAPASVPTTSQTPMLPFDPSLFLAAAERQTQRTLETQVQYLRQFCGGAQTYIQSLQEELGGVSLHALSQIAPASNLQKQLEELTQRYRTLEETSAIQATELRKCEQQLAEKEADVECYQERLEEKTQERKADMEKHQQQLAEKEREKQVDAAKYQRLLAEKETERQADVARYQQLLAEKETEIARYKQQYGEKAAQLAATETLLRKSNEQQVEKEKQLHLLRLEKSMQPSTPVSSEKVIETPTQIKVDAKNNPIREVDERNNPLKKTDVSPRLFSHTSSNPSQDGSNKRARISLI